MSDPIKHECGIALIRLLKPLEYYQQKYGTWRYGINKLYLLMEKQHNRGQDGAGIVNVKFDLPSGNPYIHRHRSNMREPIREVFGKVNSNITQFYDRGYDESSINDPKFAYENVEFAGELLLGHLRYGTFGRNNLSTVHPVLRSNNWKSRSLVLAGNFNLTNVDELYQDLLNIGQHPVDFSDTVTILENVGHFLDEEVEKRYREFKSKGYESADISPLIAEKLDIQQILKRSSKKWDGGYVIAGLIGHGDAFVLRDPNGIRPAFWYQDDEVLVVTSERPVIQTAFNVHIDAIKEVLPGHAVIVKKNGNVEMLSVNESKERKSCSFERIYFSRGSDVDIYQERKKLGYSLVPAILKSVKYDLVNTVFSYIPNTAETAFYGMIQGIEDYIRTIQKEKITTCKNPANLDSILSMKPRVEKIAIKDVKLRTFITQDKERDDLVAHVYDVTYGTIKAGEDTLVVIDDSIVRGTTLKQSIIRILDRLKPKKIIVVSSSPQIRYPDCYGIDMAKLSDFIAFKAAISLLNKRGMEKVITQVFNKCKAQKSFPKEEIDNYVKDIYAPFTDEEISAEIASLLKTEGVGAEVEVIYQKVDDLHFACPNDLGDWYFTGDYPTPGGNRVVNNSFIKFMEGSDERGY